MRTRLDPAVAGTADGAAAERILRKCVHCGFCNAACPTYRLLGDELDGPRGRIYLVKQVLEGERSAAPVARAHLDRCLGCRACEAACPSGVEYGELLELGRVAMERTADSAAQPRPMPARAVRALLGTLLRSPRLLRVVATVGRRVAPLLPDQLAAPLTPRPLPGAQRYLDRPLARHRRRIVLLEGCVQPALLPGIDRAASQVFDAVGIETLRIGGGHCCGALRLHLGQVEAAHCDIRASVDACWAAVEQGGAEALTSTASACAAMLKEWSRQLQQDDPLRAEHARRLANMARDPLELLEPEIPVLRSRLGPRPRPPVTFHAPCTLQHGQRLAGRTEALLRALGWEALREPAEASICCGSAGTYALLQPQLAAELQRRKLEALDACAGVANVSANVGCILHLQGTQAPTGHWLELLAAALAAAGADDPA